MKDCEFASAPAIGLGCYAAAVADTLGDTVVHLDYDAEAEVAMALMVLTTARVPTFPDRSLVVTWDEANGWALRVRITPAGETAALAYLGKDVLPRPKAVSEFLTQARCGAHPGTITPPAFRRPNADDDLEARLATYA